VSQQEEIDLFWKRIVRGIEAIIACLDEAPAEDWNWKPVENASSLYALAAHTIGSTEEHIIEGICGQAVGRDREAEFSFVSASAPPIHAAWNESQQRIVAALAALPDGALDTEYNDPSLGKMTAREILLITAQHCGEHRGHAELTLQLLMATSGTSNR
jgi:uncharacterized damage-inducible protein DinB